MEDWKRLRRVGVGWGTGETVPARSVEPRSCFICLFWSVLDDMGTVEEGRTQLKHTSSFPIYIYIKSIYIYM